MRRIIIIIIFAFLSITEVYANEEYENVINNQIDSLDYEEIDKLIKDNELSTEFNFKSILKSVISGDTENIAKNILNAACELLYGELSKNTYLMKNLILICILCAVLKVVSDSFASRESGELGFYVCYIITVMILFSAFSLATDILKYSASVASLILKAMLPIAAGVLIFSGNSGAYVFHPVILLAAEMIVFIIEKVIIPILLSGAVIQMVNFLTPRQMFSKLSELLKDGANIIVKTSAFLFAGILSLQKVGSVSIDKVTAKTAKFAVNMVPVVGDALSGTIDSVFYWASVLKSGTAAAIIIIVVLLCIVPVIKLCAIILIYKVTAALIQPVCDKRIVEGIDSMSKFTSIILSCVITILFMLIFSVMVVLGFSSVTGG